MKRVHGGRHRDRRYTETDFGPRTRRLPIVTVWDWARERSCEVSGSAHVEVRRNLKSNLSLLVAP